MESVDKLMRLDGALAEPVQWASAHAFLKISIMVVVAGALAFAAALLFLTPEQTGRVYAVLVLIAVLAAVWILLACGKSRTAVTTMVVGGWSYITIASFFYGGVSGTSVIMYPVTILLTGWLVSTRAATLVAILSVVVTFGLMLGELWGMLPTARASHPLIRWVVECCAFIITAMLISYVVRSYRERLGEVHRLGSDLAQRTFALQAIEADLNRAQAVAHVGSWVYDLPNDKMMLSEETCRIFGLRKRNTGSYKSYRSRVHQEDCAAVEKAWQAALSGIAPFDNEHRIVIGRTVRWVRQRAEFEFNADGQPMRAVGTTQDITERKQAESERAALEAQLRESQKMEALGTLAGGIAHDFNNAIAIIAGNVVLARQDVGSGHPALRSLDEIVKANNRAKALVQQILAFGRRQMLERKRIALAPVLNESVRLLRATQPPGVTLNLLCAPDAPPIMADASQIQQIIINLCTNAWHAMEGEARPGVLDIHLYAYQHLDGAVHGATTYALGDQRPGLYACLVVRDNGTGMDEATQRRIFEPFFTTKPVGKGTGLGLPVVHGIVEGHGACIEINSKRGAGTEICIYFPAAAANGTNAGNMRELNKSELPPGAIAPHSSTQGKHILYLDDDEALVILVSRLLQRRGYSVSGYTIPAEALAAVRATPMQFDLVVTDYNMPEMSGLVMAQEVKKIRADLPVAMASGHLTDDLRAQSLDAGVLELIYKPNTVEELCETVERLIKVKA